MKKASEINVREIEKKINYTFTDKSLLIQAFTRTSYCNEVNLTGKAKYHSNEVLEFFGDGVLSLSIITFLLKECTERYEHGIKTELGEGDFSNIKSKLSDKQNLSRSMKALGLEKYLLMGEGDAKLGIQNEPSVMEDLFESIVGAIFIDSDMNMTAVIKAVSSMLDMSVYTDRQKVAQSAKNALQEWCADKKRRLPAPRYETLSEDGPDHKKTYMRGCYIGDKLMGRGVGKNYKLADAAAAEDALNTLIAHDMTTTVVKNKNNSKKSSSDQTESSTEIDANSAVNTTKDEPKAKIKVVRANPTAALKSYASSQKKPSPSFKDLGQRKVGTKIEYAVECSFDSLCAVGAGKTRLDARETASNLILDQIEEIKRTSAKKSSSNVQKTKKSATKTKQNHGGKSRSVKTKQTQVKKAVKSCE